MANYTNFRINRNGNLAIATVEYLQLDDVSAVQTLVTGLEVEGRDILGTLTDEQRDAIRAEVFRVASSRAPGVEGVDIDTLEPRHQQSAPEKHDPVAAGTEMIQRIGCGRWG